MTAAALKNNPPVKKTGSKAIIQPKLLVNAPGDRYEQEADAMADRVMRMGNLGDSPSPTGMIGRSVQRKCTHCEEEEKKKKGGTIMRQIDNGYKKPFSNNPISGARNSSIQRKCAHCDQEEKKKSIMRKGESGGGFEASSGLTAQLNNNIGTGFPLPEATKGFMENAFNTDFSQVRIHTDSYAVAMNQEVNAKAFTYGSDIYFGSGKYAPESSDGKRLLVHELAHTLHQNERQEYSFLQRQMDPDFRPFTSEYSVWQGFHLGQHSESLSSQNSSTIGKDVDITKEIIEGQILSLFKEVQKIQADSWKFPNDEFEIQNPNYLSLNSYSDNSIVPNYLLEQWGYAKFYLEHIPLLIENYRLKEGLNIGNDMPFEEIFKDDIRKMHHTLNNYYNSFNMFIDKVKKYYEDANEYIDRINQLFNSLKNSGKQKCNVNHHSVNDFYFHIENSTVPSKGLPNLMDFHEGIYFIFTLQDIFRVNIAFEESTKMMESLFESLLTDSSPEMKKRKYLRELLKRQEELANNRPDAIRIPAVFYPEKEIIDVKKEDGSADQMAKEIPWLFYLYNTGFRGFGNIALASGEWVLADLTTPAPKGKDFVANIQPSKSTEAAFLAEGWKVDPPKELFEALNSKIRFPKGLLYWTLPKGEVGSVRTDEPLSLSGFLAGLGIALAALGLILITAGAAAPFVYGAFAASSAVGVLSVFEGWDEKSKHNMLTEKDLNQGIFSIVMEGFSMISLGLGKLANVTAKTTHSFAKGNQIMKFIGRSVAPVVSKIDKGLEITNILLISDEIISQYYLIENSSLSPEEKAKAKRQLAFTALKTGAMVIGPRVLGRISGNKPIHLEVNDGPYLSIVSNSATPQTGNRATNINMVNQNNQSPNSPPGNGNVPSQSSKTCSPFTICDTNTVMFNPTSLQGPTYVVPRNVALELRDRHPGPPLTIPTVLPLTTSPSSKVTRDKILQKLEDAGVGGRTLDSIRDQYIVRQALLGHKPSPTPNTFVTGDQNIFQRLIPFAVDLKMPPQNKISGRYIIGRSKKGKEITISFQEFLERNKIKSFLIELEGYQLFIEPRFPK